MTQLTPLGLDHEERVKKELKDIGISRLGMLRFTSRYLYHVIHPDEHVMAAVYGRRREAPGIFGLEEGLLVATDKRVIYIIHRPGYTTMDEVSYNVVSGVNISNAGPYASATLFTKISNYTLSFIRPKLAEKFADFIEERVLDTRKASDTELAAYEKPLRDSDALAFLSSHDIGVVSSLERTGSVSSAVVYYTMINGQLYFMTKTGTRKASNLLGNQQVATTVFDAEKRQTVQIQGIVQIESDPEIIQTVTNAAVKLRHYDDGDHLPPVVKLGGDNIVFHIVPVKTDFTDYSNR